MQIQSRFFVLLMFSIFVFFSSGQVLGKSADEVAKNKNIALEKSQANKNAKTTKASKSSSKEKSQKSVKSPKNTREVRPTVLPRTIAKAPSVALSLSSGTALGLGKSVDALNLKSNVAMVVDQLNQDIIFEKHGQVVLPVASITKLITAMVVLDAKLPMEEILEINDQDAAIYKNSRLIKGTTLSRQEALLLSLMSSENRAAYTLGRNYPGGIKVFMADVNLKAKMLGMRNSTFEDPTGLTSKNVASAEDLAILVSAAYQYPLIRQYSITPSHAKDINRREQIFLNSNRLVRSGDMEVLIQKTGYISQAGRCLVMMAMIQNKTYTMIFLDSVGVQSRFADAIRVREWLENGQEHATLRKLPSP